MAAPASAEDAGQPPEAPAETADEFAVAEFLSLLEEHRRKCVANGQYREAELAQARLDDLKRHEQSRLEEAIRSRHLAERLDVEEAHLSEFTGFNEAWDGRMTEFNRRTMALEKQMLEDHAAALRLWRADMWAKLSRHPKFSKELLHERKVERQLAAMHDYAGAEAVKARADTMEEWELKNLRKTWKKKRKVAQLKFVKQQAIELAALRKRIVSGREKQKQARRSEMGRLLQRYSNVKADLSRQQNLDRTHTMRYKRYTPRIPPARRVDANVNASASVQTVSASFRLSQELYGRAKSDRTQRRYITRHNRRFNRRRRQEQIAAYGGGSQSARRPARLRPIVTSPKSEPEPEPEPEPKPKKMRSPAGAPVFTERKAKPKRPEEPAPKKPPPPRRRRKRLMRKLVSGRRVRQGTHFVVVDTTPKPQPALEDITQADKLRVMQFLSDPKRCLFKKTFQVRVTGAQLAALIHAAHGVDELLLHLKHMEDDHERFDSFDDLGPAVERRHAAFQRQQLELLQFLASERCVLFRNVKAGSTLRYNVTDAHTLYEEGGAGINTFNLLQEFADAQETASTVPDVVQLLQAAAERERQEVAKGKKLVIEFLQHPRCTLFGESMHVSEHDIERIVKAGRTASETLHHLNSFQRGGLQFGSIQALEAAVMEQHAELLEREKELADRFVLRLTGVAQKLSNSDLPSARRLFAPPKSLTYTEVKNRIIGEGGCGLRTFDLIDDWLAEQRSFTSLEKLVQELHKHRLPGAYEQQQQ